MKLKQDKLALIELCKEKLTQLPSGEIKYYLFILIHTMEDHDHSITYPFLEVLLILLNNLAVLHSNNFDEDILDQINNNYNQLHTIAKTNTLPAQAKIVLLHTGGSIAALFCGVMGGLIGGTIGFGRGIWNNAPFKGLGVGFFTGLFLGAMVGFRTPKKLCKDKLVRQIEFGLNGIGKNIQHLTLKLKENNQYISILDGYLEKEMMNIRNECFTNDEDFKKFLNDDISYEINSFKAGFLGGSSLHGYLGQHMYIVITINEKKYLIEFANIPADLNEKPDQQEIRTVKGSKLVEMLAAYKKQLVITPCTLGYVVKKMKPGDNDCHSFIDKILIATNQPGINLSRYNDMNSVGQGIGLFIKGVSPLPENFFVVSKNSFSK